MSEYTNFYTGVRKLLDKIADKVAPDVPDGNSGDYQKAVVNSLDQIADAVDPEHPELKSNNYQKSVLNLLEHIADNYSGGSSDFTTCTLTIETSNDTGAAVFGSFYADDEGFVCSYGNTYPEPGTQTERCILYKGAMFIEIQGNTETTVITGSGNIELEGVPHNKVGMVTGDATITITISK